MKISTEQNLVLVLPGARDISCSL